MHKLCLVLLAISIQANDIRISEVMSNPQGSEYENEFVEIFNSSDHVIQINGWTLSDGIGVDTISHLSGLPEVQPGHYALIVDPGYNFLTGPYAGIQNDSLPIYTISTDGSFGSGGLSNTGEMMIIQSPDSSILSDMYWTTATQNGHSWELVSLTSADSLAIWQESLEINGTPGFRNSVTPPLINLAITSAVVVSQVVNEVVEVLVHIENTGELPVQNYSVSAYRDDNQNGVWDEFEWTNKFHFDSELAGQEQIDQLLPLFTLLPGVHQIELRVLTADDEVADDDALRLEVKASYPRNSVSITEVMYSPTPEQEGEWVEIQNRTNEQISLQGWTFSDANQTRHPISDSLFILNSFEYLTLCASDGMANYFNLNSDEYYTLDSWPALNSASDSVRLFDATGQEIAAVFYRGSWGNSGISLERRHPDRYPLAEINWAASTDLDGGTPSRMNTQHLLPLDISITGINLSMESLIGPSQATISIYFQNMGIDTLYSLEVDSDADIFWHGVLPSFEIDSLVFCSPMLWPGYTEIPIKLLCQGDILADTSVQVLMGYPPGQIALNEIHYHPVEDQVEFLEFVNIGSMSIDIKGWKYRDRSGGEGAVLSSCTIPPDSLFLWTTDAQLLSDLAPANALISELSAWPSLNNSSDSIIILDPLGNRMLAHGYEAPVNHEAGRSLERVALWKPQEEETSWAICQAPQGVTPGEINSVLIPPQNLSLVEFVILDSFRVEDSPFDVRVLVRNAGATQVEGAELFLQIFYKNKQNDSWSAMLPILEAGDTLAWDVEAISTCSGWVDVQAQVQFPGDENPKDNIQARNIYVSATASNLVINEVMPLPMDDHSEWLEIYNRGQNEVNLKGWLVADHSESPISISDTSLIVEAHDYLVVGNNQAYEPALASGVYQGIPHFPTLNNSEDHLMIIDPLGLLMDEMSYGPGSDLVSGRSLERIRPVISGQNSENWGVCIDNSGSTPGGENSLYLDVLPSKLEIELDPNPFSPNADVMSIAYELPFEHGLMSIMVFDMAGRKVAEPVQVKPVSHRGKVFWDGAANYGGKIKTGLYIMKILFDDQAGKVWSILKKVYLVS